MTIWLTILGMAVVTYGVRLLPLTALNADALPEWVRRGLVYVPVAVLSAIIGPAFVPSTGWGAFSIDAHLVAGVVAIGVAWYTKSTLLTIGVGMLVLLVLA